MKVLNVLNLLPDSLQSLDNFRQGLEYEIYEEGMVDAYEVLAKLRLFEKLIKDLTKSPRFKEAVSSELSDGENDFGEFTIKESSRDSYDFSKDENYKVLKKKEEEAKEALKNLTDFLIRIPEDGFIDEDSGECFEKPPILSSTKVISVSWKKQKKQKDYKDNHLDGIFK